MSETEVDAVLAHFGVKGMKWGVRKAPDSSGGKKPKMSKIEDTRGNKLTKADAKWARQSTNFRKGIGAYNKAADSMNKTHIPRINNKPQYKNADFTHDSPLRRKYYKEYQTTFENEFNKELKTAFGDSPSGIYKVKSDMGPDGFPAWTVDYTEIKHADASFPINIRLEKGKIVHFSVGSMTHSEDVEEFLAHFGVKGMKWGIRKNKVKSDINSADAARAKATQDLIKKHGTQAVDNKELQHLVTRMNLEKQYNSLMTQNPGKIKKGHLFVKELIGAGKTAQDAYNLFNGPLAKAVGRQLAAQGTAQVAKPPKVKTPKVKTGFV